MEFGAKSKARGRLTVTNAMCRCDRWMSMLLLNLILSAVSEMPTIRI